MITSNFAANSIFSTPQSGIAAQSRATSKTQNTSFADTLAANTVSSQSRTMVLDSKALVSAAQLVPGGGWINASVYKSENYSEDNPVFLVKGTDFNGKSFEAEININNINPRNTSFVELFALDGFYAANGQSISATRAAAHGAFAMPGSAGIRSAFSQHDFIPSITEMMNTQRYHGNWDGYMQYKNVIDSLLSIGMK